NLATRHVEGGVVLADRLLVRAVEQAVHLAVCVVVQLELRDAELVGFLLTRPPRELSDCLFRELQVVVVVHETRHCVPLYECGGLTLPHASAAVESMSAN